MTGSLVSNDTLHIILASKYFDTDSAYSVKAWTSLPNNYNDTINYNDTASVSDIYPGLIGTYTIGGANPDFADFTEAVEALKKGGILGNVIFNVRNGTYNEKLTIPAIVGATERNHIIFQSENLDSSKVTLINNTNSSASNFTVKLDGAIGITFKHLKISTGNTSYGRVIDISEGASLNTFSNSILESSAVNSTSTHLAVVYIVPGSSKHNNSNTFSNNVIKNGAFGIYNYGYTSSDGYDKHLKLANNTIQSPHYSGIFIQYSDTVDIQNNSISLSGNYSSSFGLRLEYSNGMNIVSGNLVNIPNGYMGFYIYNMSSPSNSNSIISNNMINVDGNSSTYGMYFYGSNTKFYNNNIRNSSSNSSSYCAYFTSSNNIKSLNNIFKHEGNGLCLYTSSTSSIIESDHNCYFSNGSNLAYWGGNRTDLSALQSANSKDANSVSLDPKFVSSSDLHTRAIALHGTGMFLNDVTIDFDGEMRDTMNPDIGADEFEIPSPNDAGISNLHTPKIPFSAGNQAMQVVITNFGSDTLKSASINWTMNSNVQTPYSWTGNIPSGESDTVNIGTFNFSAAIDYNMSFWTRLPNGISDTIYYNDTLNIQNHASALAGVYTIGGTLPDFSTISEARDALESRGVIDSVVFKIRNGTYNEQIEISPFPGMASVHPVTFTSESNDSSKVTITSNASNYVFSINGAKYITISHLGLLKTLTTILKRVEN
ncbi:MAG: hypothetical protein R2852_04565 [Bacteroidia bacterium]